MREWEAVLALEAIPEVEFAELDVFHQRQFTPDDPQLGSQWHHSLLGSFQAWSYGLGQASVRVAIVDTPFQMDHPDLTANTVNGWDAVANLPVTSGAGIAHSTLCAGLAAAVIDNHVGVAGVANCQVLPININGASSEMYNAMIWAADHDVRVVSISWSGADSDVLEAGAYYLKTRARGLVIMSAIDGTGHLDWTNQPDIYCISMTDTADNFAGTMNGTYIDFAAPGYQVFSTTTGNSYTTGTGTSYAAPLVSGIVAWLLGLNSALGPDEIIAILKNTARDLGPVGYDPYFGYGRIDFAAAAAATVRTLPALSGAHVQSGQFIVVSSFQPGLAYTLWRTSRLLMPTWSPVPNAIATTNGSQLLFLDPAPPPESAYYRVQAIGR
jgi:subtilisin family serine protease